MTARFNSLEGYDVEIIVPNSNYPNNIWVLVGRTDLATARAHVEAYYGKITESDETEDGRWSFAVDTNFWHNIEEVK